MCRRPGRPSAPAWNADNVDEPAQTSTTLDAQFDVTSPASVAADGSEAPLHPCPSCSCLPAAAASAPDAQQPCAFYQAHASRPRLLHFQELPPVLRFNKWIRSGYRAGLSHRQCVRSLRHHHNETGNILTHALPALFILGALASGLATPWEGAQLQYYASVASLVACFSCSALYHTFLANHHCYHIWLGLDVCGVFSVMVGAGHLVLWWGLHCHPALRLLFCGGYYLAAAACVVAALRADSALRRGAPLVVLFVIRLASFAARAELLPAGAASGSRHYLWMELLCLLGGVLNMARVPERWFQPRDPRAPAPLDFWLNSHQLMHVLVVAALAHLHAGAAADHRLVAALGAGELQCRGGAG